MNQKIKIGITHGDLNGIGYEVILKTLSDERCAELFTPVLYASAQVWNYYKKSLGIHIPLKLRQIRNASEAVEGEINMIEVNQDNAEVVVQYGQRTAVAGKLAATALQLAREDLVQGRVQAVVTAPISKEVITATGFPFVGHTGFFAEPYSETHRPMMLFAHNDIRVGLVTIHEAYADVSGLLTLDSVYQAIRRMELALKQDFGIIKPKIAVMGLNPHAGENGLLGREEIEVIAPAIKQCRDEGMLAFGPFPADGFWGSGNYACFDAVLAMYHDQGLLPFKLLAMDAGVNVTAGLPIVRTSPDHGTAFDIAGKGVANESSFRNAIYRAIDIYRNRQRYIEANRNPLKKRYVERGKDNVHLDLSKSDDEI